jgi:hypothetical protein
MLINKKSINHYFCTECEDTPDTTCPLTQRMDPEYLSFQQHRCENLKSSSSTSPGMICFDVSGHLPPDVGVDDTSNLTVPIKQSLSHSG